MEHFGNVVGRFIRFRNNYRLGSCEVVQPDARRETGIGQPDQQLQNVFIKDKDLDMGPGKVIMARGRPTRTAG